MTIVMLDDGTYPTENEPSQEPARSSDLKPIADASVAIAEIEANKEIEVAKINADRSIAETELYTVTDDHSRRLDECQQSIESLRTEMSQLTLLIQALLTPPAPSPENLPSPDESSAATPESQKVAEEPVKRKPAFRLI